MSTFQPGHDLPDDPPDLPEHNEVTIPPASRAQAYWEAKHVEALRAAGEANPSLMPQIIERLAAIVRDLPDLPDLRHATTFRRRQR